MILLVNQHTVPIFVDVVNAFASSENEVILFTGHVEEGGQPLSPKVKLVKSISYNRKSTSTRLSTWLLFSIHYFFYLLFARKPLKILVVTNPPFTPIITHWIGTMRSIPFFILLYDLYPDALAQAGLLQQSHFVFRQWKKLNVKMFSRAVKIFTLSDSMKKAALVYLPQAPQKFVVIHNWADTDYIHPIPKSSNSFLKANNLEGKRVILYSGNMGLTHDLESLLAAAEFFKTVPDVVFVFIGDGGKRDALLKMKQDRALTNVLFLPFQNRNIFPLAMAAADIGVVTLGSGAEGISVPSKTYINMAAGLPIVTIAPLDSELNRIVTDFNCGIVCKPGEPAFIADAIRQLLNDSSLLEKYRRSSLEAAQQFTPRNAIRYVQELGVN
jgi:glycosyltransferase involved in cell wall biosynthesis